MDFLATFFTTTIGKYIALFLALVVFVCAAFFYGYHVGSSSCQESEVKASLSVEQQKNQELQKQIAKANETANNIAKKLASQQTKTKTIYKEIPTYIKEDKNCDIPKNVIDLINQERKNK